MLIIGVILAAVFFMCVLHWWAEGSVGTLDGFLLAVIFCGLIFGLFAAHTTSQFLIAFIPLLVAGCYFFYMQRTGSLQSFYKKKCKEYISSIQMDPRNMAAREYLADTLYSLGNLDQAVDELRVVVNNGGDYESQNKLSKWEKEQHLRDTDNPVCKWCNTENDPGAKTCKKCGAVLPCQNAFSRWLVGGKAGKGRYFLLVATGLAMTITSIFIIPLKCAFIPTLLFVTALAGWWMVSSSRS